MQQENKILLSAILILGIAMLSSSFLSLTGNVANCAKSNAVASPNEINSGETVTIKASGGDGFYEEARVYKRGLDRNGKVRDSRISQAIMGACGGKYRCKEGEFIIQTFSSDVNNAWISNQDYVVKLKDVCTGDFTIEAPFRIR